SVRDATIVGGSASPIPIGRGSVRGSVGAERPACPARSAITPTRTICRRCQKASSLTFRKHDARKPAYRFEILLTVLGCFVLVSPSTTFPPATAPAPPPELGLFFSEG